MLIRNFCVRVAVPSNLAPFFRLGKQLLLGVGADLDRADLVQAAIDQLLRAQRAMLLQPADDRLYAGQRGIAIKEPLLIHSFPVCQPSTEGGLSRSWPI